MPYASIPMKLALTLLVAAVALTGCESSGYSKGSAERPLIQQIFDALTR